MSVCRSASEAFPGMAKGEAGGETNISTMLVSVIFRLETSFRPSSKDGPQMERLPDLATILSGSSWESGNGKSLYSSPGDSRVAVIFALALFRFCSRKLAYSFRLAFFQCVY